MVLQEYLQEDMYINNEIACAYVKIGPKASELMTKKDVKVNLFLIEFFRKCKMYN